jgi:hypothetical protein
MTKPTDDLIDLMREYGVEVHMLGTDEDAEPSSTAMCDMLTEIHTLRSRISAETAALAVAEPIIRARVIEELAGEADRLDAMTAPGRRWFASDIADWLRAQIEEPDDRKIYIGFKQKDKDRD